MTQRLVDQLSTALEAYRETGYVAGGATIGRMYDILQGAGWMLVADDLITRWAADHSEENTRKLIASVPFQVSMLQTARY